MVTWKQYNEIKKLINQYWVLREDKKYDEFIKLLVDELRL